MTLDPKYNALVDAAATKWALDRDELYKQIMRESQGNPLAVGDNVLALGLMQVHPGACATVGKSWTYLQKLIADGKADEAAAYGLETGAAYLAWCIKLMGGDLRWGLAAYNQGPTVIARAKRYADSIMEAPSA